MTGTTKLYAFNDTDCDFEKAFDDFKEIRNNPKYDLTNADVITNFMIITELKKLRRQLKK